MKQDKNVFITKRNSIKDAAGDKANASNMLQKTGSKAEHYYISSMAVWLIAVAVILIIVIFVYSMNGPKEAERDVAIEKTAEQPAIEKELEKAREIEAINNKVQIKEFDNGFCRSLIPENISITPIKEYTSNYHIDGSKGENVKWVASGQPPSEFSLFESPKVFFVSSSNGFEGCGYLKTLGTTKKIAGFKNEVNSQLYSCAGKEIFVKQKNENMYDEVSFYYFKSEEEMVRATTFVISKSSNKATILSNLGCEI